jgi:hypothetical protein
MASIQSEKGSAGRGGERWPGEEEREGSKGGSLCSGGAEVTLK